MNFIQRDYAAAAQCYDSAMATMKMFGLDIFQHEYLRFGVAYVLAGQKEKGEDYVRRFKDYADHNQTMYKDLHLAMYYSYKGEAEKAMELFKRFTKEQDNFLYWLLLIPTDPIADNLKKHAKFDATMKEIERKYWKKHEEMKEKWEDDFKDL